MTAQRMTMHDPKYATITQICGNDQYISYHPELPTIISQGSSPKESEANLAEATEMTICHLIENDLPVPRPISFPLTIDFAKGKL